MTRILITGQYRTGSTYLSRLVSAHSCIYGTYDSLNYLRAIVKLNRSPKDFQSIVNDCSIRLYERYGITINQKNVIHCLSKHQTLTHASIYDQLIRDMLGINNDQSWCDKTLLEWTNIPYFLSLFDDSKVLHILRDPRSILASFREMTFHPGKLYLDSVHCSLSSMFHAFKYRSILDSKRYMIVKYEDLINNPTSYASLLCDFLDMPFDAKMLDSDNHLDHSGQKLTIRTHSSFPELSEPNKDWSKLCNDFELGYINYYLRDYMEIFGYHCSDNTLTSEEILNHLSSTPLLLNKHTLFEIKPEGTESYPSDPNNPSNWGISMNEQAYGAGAKEAYRQKR